MFQNVEPNAEQNAGQTRRLQNHTARYVIYRSLDFFNGLHRSLTAIPVVSRISRFSAESKSWFFYLKFLSNFPSN